MIEKVQATFRMLISVFVLDLVGYVLFWWLFQPDTQAWMHTLSDKQGIALSAFVFGVIAAVGLTLEKWVRGGK